MLNANIPNPKVDTNHEYYDPSSYSNPDKYLITHFNIEWTVDFIKKILTGSVDLFLKKNEGGDVLILDTKGLIINSITVTDQNKVSNIVGFDCGPKHDVFGSPLTINIPSTFDPETQSIKIDYETTSESSALQWLNESQTRGKKLPFMYSQCQAIHCRSILPCQDTPSVKQTYKAKVHVENEKMRVLMSAIRLGNENVFEQSIPIPSYLLAIVVGHLHYRDLSDRYRLWADPDIVDFASYEFNQVEKIIKHAEAIMGPYEWKRYDLLILPPSFPYGGMENPCLTFVTPTIITGDKSLVNVIAHEITHSWSGNLFTNKNWSHFWINEGHTRFIEGKIVERMYGKKHAMLFRQNGYNALMNQLTQYGPKHPYSKLVLDLKGVDPDDAFSTVPYEKGAALLHFIQDECIGVEVMEQFLRALVQKYKFKSLDSYQYVDFLENYLKENNENAYNNLKQKLNWNEWLHEPDIPQISNQFILDQKDLNDNIERIYKKWAIDRQYDHNDLSQIIPLEIENLLDKLIDNAPLSPDILENIGKKFSLDTRNNNELTFRWFLLCAKSHYKPELDKCLHFLRSVGRMKYLKPIYQELVQWSSEVKQKAIKNYNQNITYMHPVTAVVIGRILDQHIS